MKKIFATLFAVLLTTLADAQTMNVVVGNVTYQFPATQTGEMTYSNGTSLTIMNKVFSTSDITQIYIDNTEVTDNLVQVNYSNSSASVTVAGNVAQYVTPTISGAHVTIAQSNTDAVNDDEITYQLSGTTTDGEFSLSGSYKCTVSLAGITLTNPSGAAINITNKKRIQLSAKSGTENTLTDGTGGDQKGCVYSKGQLQLQGKGTLNVYGNTAHAIKSADYISIKNLTLNIKSAASDGINCNGYFLMKSGTVTINDVTDDGVQVDLDGTTSTGETTDHEDEDSGNIYIEDGTLTITAAGTAAKCMKSEGDILVSGGNTTLNAQGAIDLSDTSDPSYTAAFKADGNFSQSGGDITINVTGGAGRGIAVDGTLSTTAGNTGSLTITNSGATSSGSSYFCSAKGMKAGVINLNGGTIDVTMSGAASKGIKADSDDGSGNMTISGGTITVTTKGAGATDSTEKDGKGCAGLDADGDMTISGGTITLKSTGSGGKGLKCDGVLTVDDGTITATASGSNYSSGSYSASAKAIKAGTKTGSSSGRNANYTYSGGMVFNGGTVIASASSHEAIESKNTIVVNGGYIYAYSSDDAINSGSDFTINDGYVMGNSTGNDGLDANGNFYIKGGNVFAVGTSSPEVGIDANTEQQYKLYVTGGNIVAIGGLESGSSLSQTCYQANSYSKGTWYGLYSGSTLVFAFKVPSNSKMGTPMVVSTSGSTALKSGITTSGGTSIWNGFGTINTTASGGSSVSLSSYTGGSGGGGGGGGGGHHW
ncbi:MAG: carbohydrate-binding domain-containing protein [Prevotella sp.]|nr:carbohydrate-binding domain-containing protein [Prevotella sp.]